MTPHQADSAAGMLLGVFAALSLGASLALFGWLFRHVATNVIEAADPPAIGVMLRAEPSHSPAVERAATADGRASDPHLGPLILYGLLRSQARP